VAHAQENPDVLGVFVFGSRGRPDGLADERSDYDVAVVVRDDAALAAFDKQWPYEHGASLEISSSTLSDFRTYANYGTPGEWARYQYARVDVVVDKTGEIASILEDKRGVPDDVRDRLVREGLVGFINRTYRSLRYGEVGVRTGSRLDAAESLPPLLNALFALDGRVRPFNKYLESELRERPLSDPAFGADILLARLRGVLSGDSEQLRALFRDVERLARERGFGDAIDEWESDSAWLRGEREYRRVTGGD